MARAETEMPPSYSADSPQGRHQYGCLLLSVVCANLEDLMRRNPPFYR
jgi:hypothetical protein